MKAASLWHHISLSVTFNAQLHTYIDVYIDGTKVNGQRFTDPESAMQWANHEIVAYLSSYRRKTEETHE